MNHKNILLVEDDPDDQFVFMDAMNEIASHVECITANNGIEALALLKNPLSVPSLIFLDLNMPLMNGFECLKQIKENKQFKQIPVIILTTSKNPDDHRLSKEFGAEKFITKTSDFKLLKRTLQEILKTDFNN
jgi:CheY-like chemotaxis protein